ncbi:unnamed protein product [Cladocopium goreaui]|uniref:Dynein heavy chain 2, axonemal n=1 Tax=Cladocopium goreaui TaxID=2562237 RepID=A0A9P1D3A1_9DINO|nr:unnamed protein product [Cladocopium goreaui]
MGLPRVLAESAAIASHVLRPLCVDPQEQALSWLRKRVDFVTHVGSPKLPQALQHCQEGRSLLLLGVTDQLPACVVEFYQPEVEQKEPKGSPAKSSASLGEEEKDSKSKKGKGKIFVVTPDLPWRSLALSPLDVVNFEVVEVEQILLRAMSKEPLQLQVASLKDFPSNQREFLQLEEKIQLLLAEGASHKTGILGDNDLMSEISTSRCRCCELQEMNQEALLQRRNFLEKRRNFLRAARSCATLFRSMHRLAQLGVGSAPSLFQMEHASAEACATVLKSQGLMQSFGKDSSLQVAAALMSLSNSPWLVVSRVLQRFSWSYFRHQQPLLLLLLMMAFQSQPQEPLEMNFLLNPESLRSEVFESADVDASNTLPAAVWQKVRSLSALKPQIFGKLPESILANADAWHTALCCGDPLPYGEAPLGAFDRLLLARAVQPFLVFQVELKRYALEVLDGDQPEVPNFEEVMQQALEVSVVQKEDKQQAEEKKAEQGRKKSVVLVTGSDDGTGKSESMRRKSAAPDRTGSRKDFIRKQSNVSVESTRSTRSARKKSQGDLARSVSRLERKKSHQAMRGAMTPLALCRARGRENLGAGQAAQAAQGRVSVVESDCGGSTMMGSTSEFDFSGQRRKREMRKKAPVPYPILLVLTPDAEPSRYLARLAAAQLLEQYIGAKQQELRVLNVGRWQTDSGHLMEMVKDAYKRGRWLLLENIELESDIHLPLDCFLTSILEGPEYFDREKGSALPGFRLFLSTSLRALQHVLRATLRLKCVALAWELPRGAKALLQRCHGVTKVKDTSIWNTCEKYQEGRRLLVQLARFQAVLQAHPSRNQEMPFHYALMCFEDLLTRLGETRETRETKEAKEAPPVVRKGMAIANTIKAEAIGRHAGFGGFAGGIFEDVLRVVFAFANALKNHLTLFAGANQLSVGFSFHLSLMFTSESELSRRSLAAIFESKGLGSPRDRSFGDSLDDGAMPGHLPSFAGETLEDALEFLGHTDTFECQAAIEFLAQFCGVLFTDHKNDLDLGGERLRCAATVSDETAPVSTNPEEDGMPEEVASALHLHLLRELELACGLLRRARTQLEAIIGFLEGSRPYDPDTAEVFESIRLLRTPSAWLAMPPRTALASWSKDVTSRILSLHSWEEKGKVPVCFSMASFFNPQGFLTAVLQGMAHLRKSSLEKMHFEHHVEHLLQNEEEVAQQLQADRALDLASFQGVFVANLVLVGASWSRRKGILEEPDPLQPSCVLPVIRFNAVDGTQEPKTEMGRGSLAGSKGPVGLSKMQEALRARAAPKRGSLGGGRLQMMMSKAANNRIHNFSCPLLLQSPFRGQMGLWCCDQQPLDFVDIPMGSCESQDQWLLRDTAIVIHAD